MKYEKNGDLIRVEMPNGAVTLIDVQDEILLQDFPVWVERGRYISLERSIETAYGMVRQEVYLARAIAIRKFGLNAMQHYLVDHADQDRFNNRRSNLRLATTRQNAANRSRKKGESGYRGVCIAKRNLKKKFVAYIGGLSGTEFKSKNLGYFDTAEDAARAYDKEARKRFGEFAVLNFPAEVG